MFSILLSPPDVGELEHKYVSQALRSGWVAPAGPDLTAFEEEVADRVGVAHAVGLSSGTAALHLALVSWGVGPGDVVPVSTLTFAATVNAIRYVGATPHFVDCDPETGNMSPQLLEQAFSELADQGARVPVVVPVDLLGKCVDYTPIARAAEAHGARLLADSAESFGATYQDRAAGSFGAASVLSFNGNKIMTTSGGGMLLTDDERLASHVRKLSTQAREPVAHYEHEEIGYNYRLSNILAALGRGQLTRLDEMIKRRREWRERYRAMLAPSPGVRILGGADDTQDNCWLTAIVVEPSESRWTVDHLGAAMAAAGIETRPVWKPMHLQPVSTGLAGTLDGSSERIFKQGLTLPSGSALSDDQFNLVQSVIQSVIAS
ncbi:aminotransferase class I/II-fold pyridoxal phosphate-dependent enzyme [Nocardioides sp. cx-169]|uniref:DegT/DnrJ/EryC1/StrS family aminotransferase n=1 Tax=Nocardioides sp. cx-169 TaxID=2899080 RepID=UPI001E298FAC|nr:aminotransferase class I/II-fold pyridoxal phosphate-dependent enzyme [Nocardioides sp. cx-169]MCD4533740.1 aminotransferase class I/II-fold pyridoxal phosphate-dependent enzyme [Nocardioides sp. cx-169]